MKIKNVGHKMGTVEELRVTIRDKYGNIKKDYIVNRGLYYRLLKKLGLRHNSITYKGMNGTAALITGNSTTKFQWIDIGTGTNVANNAQTALQTTLLTNRGNCAAGTYGTIGLVKTDSGSSDNETCQWVWTFSSANNTELTGSADVVTEVGIFSAVTSGVMLLRLTWAGDTCNWSAGDTLQLTVKCQIKQGS
jgi:hypothetical protein